MREDAVKKYVAETEEDWLGFRRDVITATLSSSLIGANKYQSMMQGWKEKGSFKGNAFTVIGNWLEPVVVEATNYALNTDFELFEKHGKKIFFLDEDHKLGATPDAHSKDNKVLLECKTTKPFNYIRYGNNPPVYYIAQLMCQLHCSRRDKGYLSIMSTDLSQDSPELRLPIAIFEVDKDDKVCHHMCKESLRFFECLKQGKDFRVDSKIKSECLLRLQTCYKKVF